jgi:hypothetical protein
VRVVALQRPVRELDSAEFVAFGAGFDLGPPALSALVNLGFGVVEEFAGDAPDFGAFAAGRDVLAWGDAGVASAARLVRVEDRF